MADIITVQVRLDARAATRQLNNFQRQISGVGTAGDQVEKTNKSIARSLNLLRLYASAWIGVAAALTTIREIRAAQQITRTLDVATSSTAELNSTFEEMTQRAIANRSSLEANATVYQRLKVATEELDVSSSDLLNVVDSLSIGLKLGGATGQEAAASLRQISQAFSKGKLDGDEFRSVMENMGFAMNEFRKAIGVSRAELFQMSRDGELTADVLARGFGEILPKLQKDLEALPRNVDDALQNLSTSWSAFLILLDQAGVFNKVRDAIDGLAGALLRLGKTVRNANQFFTSEGIFDPETLDEFLDRQVVLKREIDETNKIIAGREQGVPALSRFLAQLRLPGLKEEYAEVNKEVSRLFELRKKQNEIESENLAGKKAAQQDKEQAKLELQEINQANKLNVQFLEDRKRRQEEAARIEEKIRRDRFTAEEEGINHTLAAIEAESKAMGEMNSARQEGIDHTIDAIEAEAKAMEKIAVDREKNKNSILKFADDVMTIEDAVVNAFKGMEDALVEFVTTGKLDFQSLTDSIIADIARIAIQQNITKPLATAVGGLFDNTKPTENQAGTTGGLGGFITKGVNFLKGFLPGFQDGTSFTVGGKGGIDRNLVAFRASKGEQVTVTPRGQSGGINIVMNIKTNDAESFGRNQDQIMNMLQARLATAQRNL